MGALSYYLTGYFPYRKRVATSYFFFVLKQSPALILPLLLKLIIDNYVPSGNIYLLVPVLLGAFVIHGFHIFLHMTYVLSFDAGLVKQVTFDLRRQLVHKLQILSLDFHRKNHSGRLFSKVMLDVDKIDGFAVQIFDTLFSVVTVIIFTTVALFVVNHALLAIYLLVIPIYVIIFRGANHILSGINNKMRLASEERNRAIGSFLQTRSLARIHGCEEYEIQRLHMCLTNEIAVNRVLKYLSGMVGVFINLSGQIFSVAIVAIGAIFVIKGSLSIGELLLFLQYVTMIVDVVNRFLNLLPQYVEFNESVTSLREILDSEDIEFNKNKSGITIEKGAIFFKNVSFFYQQGVPLFENLNVHINGNSTVALVGSSGSGKSTFIQLVLGLHRPKSGQIYIDKHDLSTIDMRSVRRQSGVVTQEAIMFPGTIRENITYGRPEISESEIIAAAKDAFAYDFIIQLPKGFDTIIGEKGHSLSGGQKQRISIARAIIRHPKILILDEATSALDYESESEVEKALEGLRGKQTMFVIAHRLSSAKTADRILVFEQGKLVEDGTHLELIDKDGVYKKLFSRQMEILEEK